MILSEVVVRLSVLKRKAVSGIMQSHHYLGAMPKIGETLWYVAHVDGTWLALAVFSAPALKCRARDSLGWAGISVISMDAFILSPTTAAC